MGLLKKIFGSVTTPPKSDKQKKMQPPPGRRMETLDSKLVVEPFGKINTWDLPDGGKRVRAYFLMENPIEGAQTGVAIDGSGSMQAWFGQEAMRQVRQVTSQDEYQIKRMRPQNQQQLVEAMFKLGILQIVPPGPNIVEEQARQMTEYLSRFDADGGTTVIYWATGDGRQIEVIGDLTGPQCPSASFSGPKDFGSETHLLPAIRYFVDRFADARWGMYVFITDGALNDLEPVKSYCTTLARDIARGKRNDLKFVLIGVGDDVDENQMEELDDLETGTDIDLWDSKIAKEMKQLAEIFAEVVSETVIIVPGDGLIKDANGDVVQDYRDSGLPALMWFDLPPGSQWFTLEVGGQKVAQPLAAGVRVPSFEPVQPAEAAPQPAAEPETVPCIECREPLPVGTKFCTRCGTSQDEPVHQPAGAPPATQPVPDPTPPSAPPSPATPAPATKAPQLAVEPPTVDFGTITNWRGELPTQEVKLRNNGSATWSGTVQSTLPWLEVTPTSVSCPAGNEVVLTVGLTSGGVRLRPKAYSVPDAIVLEGDGQTLRIGAEMSTKG